MVSFLLFGWKKKPPRASNFTFSSSLSDECTWKFEFKPTFQVYNLGPNFTKMQRILIVRKKRDASSTSMIAPLICTPNGFLLLALLRRSWHPISISDTEMGYLDMLHYYELYYYRGRGALGLHFWA